MKNLKLKSYLDIAQLYADNLGGCRKVHVGSIIVKNGRVIGIGANRAIPDLCECRGCLRIEKYGNDSKVHRNPEDCRAIHSEIDAIANLSERADGATIYVTRYPCESCAKAIVAAGIKNVWYGGTAKVSQQTMEIFDSEHVGCYHIRDWKQDNTDR